MSFLRKDTDVNTTSKIPAYIEIAKDGIFIYLLLKRVISSRQSSNNDTSGKNKLLET